MEPTQPSTQPETRRPRLERLRGDRAVAGVASGLARYLNIDVAWVRIAFVLAALFGGTGVLLYIVGWIAMPEEGEQDSIVADKTRRFENAGSWIGIGLIAIAAMIVIENTGLIDGDLIFAGVLIVLGFLLYRGDIGSFSGSSDADATATASTVAPPPAPPAASASPIVAETVDTAPAAYEPEFPLVSEPVTPEPDPAFQPSPPQPPDPAFVPREPRPRESSALGRLALATALIALGVMGVGHSAGWWEPAIRHYVGAVFVILGAALVVGSVFGRARWLIAVGLISAPVLLGAALLDVPLEGGFGDPRYQPDTLAELESEYRLIAGELRLDLTDLELATGDRFEIDTSVVFGSLQITVPSEMGVAFTTELDAGEIRVDGNAVDQGINNDWSDTFEGVGQIVIDAHVGFGELVVNRVAEVAE